MTEATGLSQQVVDAAHREEIAQARLSLDRLSEVIIGKQAVIDVLTAERDRARDLAVRAGAFDEHPGSPVNYRRVWEGPETLPTPKETVEAERDDGR